MRSEDENRIHCLDSRDAFYKDRSANKVVSAAIEFLIKRDFHQGKFLGGWDEGYIVAEMMFLILLTILAIFELYQVLLAISTRCLHFVSGLCPSTAIPEGAGKPDRMDCHPLRQLHHLHQAGDRQWTNTKSISHL